MNIEIRVAGILVEEGKVFLVGHERPAQGRYWVLPGGHLRPGESLARALRREWKEELNLDVEVGQLIFVSDFVSANRHVLDLYFDVRPSSPSRPIKVRPDATLKEGRFFRAEELADIPFRPDILPELVRYIREGVVCQTYLGCR